MEQLFEYFNHTLEETPTSFRRYKYADIKWSGRAFGVVGPRGVGKSTMLLQHIKEHLPKSKTLYISADHLFFSSNSLIDLADRFSKMGGEHLFIDEIHKYPGWSRELKQMYDSYSDLQIVISGSSILDIYEGMADLSRRFPIYSMQGLSFREYLQFFHDIKVPVYSLEEILDHKVSIPGAKHPLVYFQDYLKRGYYPFGKDDEFELELMQVINQTLDVDIPQYAKMNASVSRKLKRLLMLISESVPFKPVMQKLADVVGTSRNNIPDYLSFMEKAGLVAQLTDDTTGIRGLGKVEKLYLDNTNLIHVLAAANPNLGNLRETFFMNQMRVRHAVVSSSISDFQIGDYVFETGGKNKGQAQIKSAAQGFVVKDDIETGYANVVPLWTFGMNY